MRVLLFLDFLDPPLVRYAFFVMVRVRYVGTLFELKIPDFSHIAPDFCMQRQKTADADAKCVN